MKYSIESQFLEDLPSSTPLKLSEQELSLYSEFLHLYLAEIKKAFKESESFSSLDYFPYLIEKLKVIYSEFYILLGKRIPKTFIYHGAVSTFNDFKAMCIISADGVKADEEATKEMFNDELFGKIIAGQIGIYNEYFFGEYEFQIESFKKLLP